MVRFFSDALGCACGCLHVTGWVGAVIAPHSSTYEVWLPDDYTSGRTPLTFVTFGRCTGRSMTACSNTSPCVLPAEYNSQRGRGSVNCFATLACHVEQCWGYLSFLPRFLFSCHHASLHLLVCSDSVAVSAHQIALVKLCFQCRTSNITRLGTDGK